MKYYLIGKNIETSLSPKIHNFLFKLKGKKAVYQEPQSERIFTIRQMQENTFGGMSITIPYKAMFRDEPLIEKRGEICQKYGISNTIFKDNERKLISVNTDIFGISKCYGKNIDLQHKNALIIGAGATAETFCAFFQSKNFKVSFINRSSKEDIKQRFSNVVDFLPLKLRPIHIKTALTYSTVVNTLPSEVVYDNWDDIELNLKNMFQTYPKNIKTRIIYMNVNYRNKLDPIEELLKGKLSLHVDVLKGIDMLLWQAVEQNRYFCQQGEKQEEEQIWQYKKLRAELNLTDS